MRADQLLQVWSNNLTGFWSDPEAKAADMLKELEAQTRETSKQLEAEMNQ